MGKTSKEDVKNQANLNTESQKNLSLEQQIIDLLKKRRGIDSDILSDQQDIANVLQDQIKQQKFLNSEKKLARDLSNQITKIAEETYSITTDELGLTKTNNKFKQQQQSLEKSIIVAKQQQVKFSKMALEGDTESRRLNADIAQSLQDQAEQAQKLSKQISQISKGSKAIASSMGVKTFGGLSDVMKAIPGLSKFAGPFEEAAEAAREHGAAEVEKNASINKGIGDYKQLRKQGMGMADALKEAGVSAKQVKVGELPLKAPGTLAAGFKSLGPAIAKAFGPVALAAAAINMMIKAFKSVDKSAGDLAKSQGMSYEAASRFNAEITDSGVTSGRLLTTTKDVVAAQIELNKIFGTSVKFSNELAAEFSEIQKTTGLSNNAMEIFAEKAMLGGTSIEAQLERVTAVTQELSSQSGIMMTAKDIQEGIGQMSAVQMLNNKMNTKEMAKQVFQAKLLGLSQSQLEGVQGSLLDFESSISAEMEAELLTGKQLNLEGARAAALAGDQAALATELRKEVGTSTEFGAMNVIQQEAMAKAFGMQREDMAAMLIEQEKLEAVKGAGFKTMNDAQEQYNEAVKNGTLDEKLKIKLAKAGLLKQMQSVTQQEKMAAMTEKVMDLFVQLVDPLMPVISAITDIIGLVSGPLSIAFKFVGSLITPIVDAVIGIKDVITAIFDPTKSLGETFAEMGPVVSGMAAAFIAIGAGILVANAGLILQSAITAALAIKAGIVAAFTMATASAATLGIGIIAVVAGIAAGMMAVKAAKSDAAGDMFSPAKGKTMVSTKEGGLFSLSPNDDLVAAPGAASALSSNNRGGGNSETNTLLRKLIAVIEEGGDVYMDGNKVGKSLALSTSNMG
tara:strand:- start:6547 stop:9096 length:2550 start_codon:yes stop_codon:yes gene_type:complete